ncbi:MAG: amino acid ABC transporter permease [Caldilineaceae bacterium]|nr:amino acid ABC transporter permease [Caldilineaceae bacterium]
MATAARTSTARILPPPSARSGPVGWLRKNLFGSLWDTLLTILALGFLYLILRPLFTWIFAADWAVIPANFTLLLRGPYPEAAVGRLWICLYLLLGLGGFSWGVWFRRIEPLTLFVLIIPALLAGIPFIVFFNRLNLLVGEGIILVAYLIGRFWPQSWRGMLGYLWLLLLIATPVILYGITNPPLLVPLVPTNLWGGLLLTLLLAIFGIVLSFPLGVALALGRQSSFPAFRLLSILYIEFIRGVPLITLLFMGQAMLQYFLPPGTPTVDRVIRALVAITLFAAAYTAENVRGGLQAIPKGQGEAAVALGLNPFQTTFFIILPQALRAIVPVLVGQFIALFKDTSLVAIVGLFDLLGIARSVLGNPNWLGNHPQIFLFIAAIYWLFCYAMAYASRQLERSLGIGER